MNEKTNFSVRSVVITLFIFTIITATMFSNADEGMWTFDNLPIKLLKERYGFVPTQEWLDHIRLASVRLGGGSGSFVSQNGLIMTNHHVAVDQLQKISTDERDYVETGFLAKTAKEEVKCPDLEVVVLVYMEDVTKSIRKAVKKKMTGEEALKAHQSAITRIEKKSLNQTGLTSRVISLYHGGEYWLYRYKKYTDVRMVMAPERQAAYFGGDFDNFTYPRFDLDVAFFRVYENDKPLKTDHFLKWNVKGAVEDELVFVSGNPGSTDRLYTYAQLEFQRDFEYPSILSYIKRRIEILREYSKKGKEEERRALIQIFGLENAKKALTGEYGGLLDSQLMEKRRSHEDEFRKSVSANPEWEENYSDSWEAIADVIEKQKKVATDQFYGRILGSRLAGFAQTLVFASKEIPKPDSERLNGYHESQLESMKYRLFSPAPVYLDMEESNLAGCLALSMDELGENHPFIQIILNGRIPEEVAKDLIQGTQLADAAYRKNLFNGGEKAVQESGDPLILLIQNLEPKIREDIEWNKKNIQSILTPAEEKIAKARFNVYGKDVYPDATFTLRLSYGTIKGYDYNGTKAPYKTTLYGLFDRAESFGNTYDFALPRRFWRKLSDLDLATPVNFVSTCDIIGGNSGSPVINAKGEVVGLIFDGNIESLPGRFVYDEAKNRAVAVHTAYITEALRKLYEAGFLADEIEGM